MIYRDIVIIFNLTGFQSATDDDTDIEDDEDLVEPSKKRRIETPEEASVSLKNQSKYYFSSCVLQDFSSGIRGKTSR